MKLTRSLKLQIYPTKDKIEHIRYTTNRYMFYLQSYINKFFIPMCYNFDIKNSTTNLGSLNNIAQKQAKDIIRGIVALGKTGETISSPILKYNICPAIIHKNKKSSFDYWINFISPLAYGKKVPAKSYSKLNKKLKNNWKLSEYCEIFEQNNKWFVRVFITKQVEKATLKPNYIGIDVGIKHSVVRSDKYIGKSLLPIINKEKAKQAERSRQNSFKQQNNKSNKTKTTVKQQLDIEVNRALSRAKLYSSNLVVEHPKVIANLRLNKLNRWARTYFHSRLNMRALEEKVYIIWVSPAYTSITCSKCLNIDKKSRVSRDIFKCANCGYTTHADLNASFNIARKGEELVNRRLTA